MTNTIHIRGARTHNLKNISLDIPKLQLVVITGVSGSGKSSLAFDTLYAEGQRRYVESLSSYARQFLQLMDKPDVDLIEGLSPAVAIEQKATNHNPRSTVGTITEIHDYLRLFFARVGTPYCPNHQQALEAQSVSQMVDETLQLPEQTKIMVLAPKLKHSDADTLKSIIQSLEAQGYVRFRINQTIYTGNEIPELDPNINYDLDVVIDRLKIRSDIQQRLAESFETALELGQNKAICFLLDEHIEKTYSTSYACPHCDYQIPTLTPQLFSFNNPQGACQHCQGIGHTHFFDPEKIVAFPSISLRNGAIKGWDKRNFFYQRMLESLAIFYDFDLDTPFEELPQSIQNTLLFGSKEQDIPFSYIDEKGTVIIKKHGFEGIVSNIERRWAESESNTVKDELGKYRSLHACPSCEGSRLCLEARHVYIGEHEQKQSIFKLEALSLADCLNWFETLTLSGAKHTIAERIIQEIKARLNFLNDVGLNYLSLDRAANTISGGEAQRIRLASQIGTGLTGVMYVLDEPSIGLHQRDNDRLIGTLQRLRDLGNTVIVVEHDEDMIRAADYVVDMGPRAGEQGGQVTAAGTPSEISQNPHSLTGQYLNNAEHIANTHTARLVYPSSTHPDQWFHLYGCHGNNLKHVDLHIPIQRLVCITGVSGSGKSTLINNTLVPILAHHFHRNQSPAAPYERYENIDIFDKIISVDQAPIGRTPRSNPATYTGLFTPIRELFADLPESRARGYDAGRFSFNVKGGRCEACQGDGVIKVEMHFLPDVYVTCDTCQGARYNRETLDIRYRGLAINEVLNLTIDQALHFFESIPIIHRKLQTLIEVGLGYIRLGQSATTLSGGEAQRVKLALELSKKETGNTLYVLDEPTTGLHFHDISLLLEVLQKLVDQGNTVLIIEHNLDIIRHADWIVDLGPEGGSGGGTIITQGTPKEVAQHPNSHTGRYLKPYLESHT